MFTDHIHLEETGQGSPDTFLIGINPKVHITVGMTRDGFGGKEIEIFKILPLSLELKHDFHLFLNTEIFISICVCVYTYTYIFIKSQSIYKILF